MIVKFPLNNCNILKDNFTTKYVESPYFKGRDYIEVNATVFFKDENEVKTLKDWFINDINKGQDWFEIELPIFGGKKPYKAFILNTINEFSFLGNTRQMNLKLKVEDVWNAAEFVCEMEQDCSTEFECEID